MSATDAVLAAVALLLFGGMGSLVAAVCPATAPRWSHRLFWGGAWALVSAFALAFAGVFV